MHLSLNLEPYLKKCSNGYYEMLSSGLSVPTKSACHISDKSEFLLDDVTSFQCLIFKVARG